MCGLLAVTVSAMNLALVFLLGAFVFDFLDGFSARKMKAESAVGKDLDSLADLVSFGVAPAVMAFKMLTSFAAGHTGPGDPDPVCFCCLSSLL